MSRLKILAPAIFATVVLTAAAHAGPPVQQEATPGTVMRGAAPGPTVSGGRGQPQPATPAVPEPASAALLIVGITISAVAARRRAKREG
jgi:hypothetical protein